MKTNQSNTIKKENKNLFIENKKRNKSINIVKKDTNYTKILLETAYKTKLIWYIKALLQVYKTIPNIINIIDKIVERKASSYFPTSTIYGNSHINTYKQIDGLLDLTQRKNKLLNLYIITEEFFQILNEQDKKFILLKFVHKYKTHEISKELNLSERSVFRKANTIIEKIAIDLLNKNYTTKFLDNQIGSEVWIHEIIKEKITEDNINKNKKLQ